MVLLLNLGKYISVPIISEWLELPDYLNLDSALGKADRVRFIEQLKEYSHLFSNVLFPSEDDVYYPATCVSWASKRHLDFPVVITNEFLDNFSVATADCFTRVQKMKCENINACHMETLMTIFVFCESLESLIFRETFSIDDYILQLSVCCPRLKHVDFSGCIDLSDYSIIALCRSCPQLESLELWKCTELSSAVIYAVIVHNRRITYFRIDKVGSRRESQMLTLHLSRHNTKAVFDHKLGESYIEYGSLVVPDNDSEKCNDVGDVDGINVEEHPYYDGYDSELEEGGEEVEQEEGDQDGAGIDELDEYLKDEEEVKEE